MKATFIVPDNPYLITQKVHPPLGVLYLAAVLKDKHEVEVLDLAGVVNPSEISGIDADYACISATTPQFPDACAIRALLPDGCISVIGGVHVTHIPSDGSSFNIVVRGEGEEAIKQIVDMGMERGLYNIPFEIANIDTIPFPDRSAVDIHSYKYEIDGIPATTMITSRGCPYSCAFCSSIWGKPRFHSAKYVLKELTEIQSYGFNAVHFFDDVFTLKRERLKTICGGLKARRMSWRCFISGNTATEDMLSLMSKSGCKEIAMGIESGSNDVLKAINKPSTVEQNKKAIQMAHEVGIRVKGLFIVGLPGESHKTIAETEAFINECPCDDYDFSVLSVLPNSDIYLNLEEYDVSPTKQRYDDMWYKGTPGMYHSSVSTSFLTAAEVTMIRNRLEKEYKSEDRLK